MSEKNFGVVPQGRNQQKANSRKEKSLLVEIQQVRIKTCLGRICVCVCCWHTVVLDNNIL